MIVAVGFGLALGLYLIYLGLTAAGTLSRKNPEYFFPNHPENIFTKNKADEEENAEEPARRMLRMLTGF